MDTQKQYQHGHRTLNRMLYQQLRAVAFVVCAGILLVTSAIPGAQAQQEAICFEETGYCMSGRIREFWEQNGGLRVFGYPISPQQEYIIEDRVIEAQEFERNRLELHPENAPPYDVLLGRLGVDRLEQQGRDWRDFEQSSARSDCRFFPETGQNVCGAFLQAWRSEGLEIDGQPGKTEAENLALFGLPLGPPMVEEIEGNEYIVQWFERTRFESHPENDPPFNVLFGLLGNEVRDFEEADPDNGDEDNGDEDNGDEDNGDEDNGDEQEEVPLRIAFASDRAASDREIYVMNPDGSDVVNLTDSEGFDDEPSWSPDGTQIAFASERDGNREIYVMDADGSNVQRLTNNRADDWNPVWSPDGWRIAFESDRDGNREIYTMSSVDGSQQTNLTNNDFDDWYPTWSPDGDQIAFQSDRVGFSIDIFVMNDDGTDQRNLTDNDSRDQRPAWSPDGELIAFDSDETGDREIYVMDADGDDREQLTNLNWTNTDATWSPDGTQIAFVSRRDGNREIYVMDDDGSNATNLTSNRADDRSPAWQPVVPSDEDDDEDDN